MIQFEELKKMIRKWELNDGRILQIEQDLDLVNKEFGATVWDCALYVITRRDSLL